MTKVVLFSALVSLLLALNIGQAVVIGRLEFERDTWRALSNEFKSDWSRSFQAEVDCYAPR